MESAYFVRGSSWSWSRFHGIMQNPFSHKAICDPLFIVKKYLACQTQNLN